MQLGVLILGQETDPHIARVRQELDALDVEVRIFDQYRHEASLLYSASHFGSCFDDWFATLDGGAVWSRVKLPHGEVREEFKDLFPAPESPVGIYQTRMHWRSEWRVFNRSLLRMVYKYHRHVAVVNRGVLLEDADCKPVQLAAARKLGLVTPKTVVGNSERALDDNFGAELLYKPLSTSPVGGTGVPMPAMLSKADLLDYRRATVAPAIYQERIAKLREVRVAVAGKSIHAIDIDSQRLNQSRLDWRAAQSRKEIYSVGSLPPALKVGILAYLAEMKLDVGALDFAVSPEGDFVFFECNPGGQWAWLEDYLGLPLSRDVAVAIHDLALAKAQENIPARAAQQPDLTKEVECLG